MNVMRRLAGWAVAFALMFTLWSGAALAQSANGAAPDYAQWETFATRIEEAVEAGRASDTVLEQLRGELTEWRTEFNTAKDANVRTISAAQAQLDALGPAPEEGASEPEEIAEQRTRLEARLAELRAPGRRADVASSRADVLISEIDGILAQRQTNALLDRGPSPLNPTLWARGWSAFTSSIKSARGEIVTAWNNPNQREAFRAALPEFLTLVSVSIVFLALGWRWIRALSRRFVRNRSTARGWLIGFALSLLQLIVALMGLLGLAMAFYLTELIGLRVDPLLDAVMDGGFFVVLTIWLSSFVFAAQDRSFNSFALTDAQNAKGRRAVIGLGVVMGLSFVLDEFARYDKWSDGVQSVVTFPLILLGGYFLWRLGRLLRTHATNANADLGEDELPRYIDRMYGLLGRVVSLMALAGVLLMAAGYFLAGKMAVLQTIETLILIAILILLQRVFAEVWVVIRRGADDARDGLIPTLAGFVLMLIAVPEFLRIWGTSDARISEFWTQAREGFQIGDTRITAGAFVSFAIVFALGYIVTRLLQGALKNTVLPKTKMDQGGQNALVSGVGYIGIFLAALFAITSAGIDLSSIALVAGALSVGIGFGLQNIVSNFVSGIILLIERPISEGDWIEVGGTHGTVRDISVRSTRIETFDRSDVILPNADFISGKVTNYTRGNTVGRVTVPVGVAYGNDTRKIERILMEIAEAHPMVLANPAPYVVFQGFGADSLDFEIRAILRDVNFVLSVRSDMNHEIARRFVEENVEIPFTQRDIWIRNPEALGGSPVAAEGNTGEQSENDAAKVTRSELSHMDEGDLDVTDVDADMDGEGGDR